MGIWSITPEEIALADRCIDIAKGLGASAVRVTLNKSMLDLYKTLNGDLDKVTRAGDRSLSFAIFADGRFGVFTTDRMEEKSICKFIDKAIKTVKMLAPDEFRVLPPQERTAKNAITGTEAGIFDGSYLEMTPGKRMETIRQAVYFDKAKSAPDAGWTIISEEAEYSDSIYDLYITDSNGLRCRHTETSFEIGCETTVVDEKGNKSSGYWWDAQPFLKDLSYGECCRKAMERAAARINPQRHKGGKFIMVVENEVSSRLVNPLLSALNAFSLQQQNSFLADTLGKKIFHKGLTIMDLPITKGATGSRLFDSEGVAAQNRPVIEDGIVKEYFVNTYMAGKMGIEPTIEDAMRACISPYWGFGDMPSGSIDTEKIMESCGDGILVTGFNGGNSDSATGDFSYGVEGFAFSKGKITGPVSSMVITGNFISLWNNLLAAGNDARTCMSKMIPTLAFDKVDFSA